jgi:hypothetical protein
MFQLTREEFDALRSQIAMSKPQNSSQIAMSSGKHRGTENTARMPSPSTAL